MRTMMKGAFALIGIGATISSANAVGASTNESELLKTTLLENSAYQLEEANGTTNVFNVTKYLENAETGELTPKVYNVVFSNQLGNPDATGDEVKYFNWEKDVEAGSYSLVEGSEGSHDLKVGLGENVYVGQTKTGEGGVTNIVSGTEIESLTGDFIGNTSSYSGHGYVNASGGAIKNSGAISELKGNFIGNAISYKGYSASSGGAIDNSGAITTLTGDFIGNKVSSFGSSSERPSGGAINNSGTITALTGDFIGNTVYSSLDSVHGSPYSYSLGGAVNNSGEIGTLTGDFIGNRASTSASSVYASAYSRSHGGALNNGGTIGEIKGDFIGNSAVSSSKGSSASVSTSFSYGGAIKNSEKIGTLTGDFIGNTAASDFASYSYSYGGAIYNEHGEIGVLTGDFIGNTASSSYQSSGGAIYNNGEIGTLTGDFIGNTASGPDYSSGGAIYNELGQIGILATADKNVSFTGNTDITGFNAIFNGDGTIRFNASANSKIVVNDKIRGFSESYRPESILSINSAINGANEKMSGTFNGVVEFNNEVKFQTVFVSGGTLKAGSYKGESIKISDTKTVSTEDAVAQFVSSTVKVYDGATLLIGANKTDSDLTVSFDSSSSLTLESGSIFAFEENASVDISGAFSATDATMFLELSDYIANLESDETLNLEDLDWTIATFADSTAAKDALAGFSNFKNDLGIAKGDENSDGLWFDVRQDGSSLKVVGVIPEPATFGLIGLAGAGLLAYRRRRLK